MTYDLNEANTVYIERTIVQYRLFSICGKSKPQFLISITLGADRKTTCIGYDAELAKRLYRKIVDGGVTPCTLSDVVEDALM